MMAAEDKVALLGWIESSPLVLLPSRPLRKGFD